VTVTEPVDNRPELLRILFPHKAPRRTGAAATLVHVPTSDEVDQYAMAALARESDAVAQAPEGQRNHTLNRAAFNIAQLCAGGYLGRDMAWDALRGAAFASGLTAGETEATLASGFKAGETHPRVIPDRTGAPIPTATIYDFTSEPVAGDDGADAGPDIEAMWPKVDWHALWADDTEDEWILEPLIPARRLIALYSAPKMGKSLLMLEVAVCISLGNRWCLGEKLGRPRTVLYIDFENDPRGDVRARLQAMGYKPDDLTNLIYLSFPSLAYLDTAMGGMQLLAIAVHYGAEVVIIDTISRAITGEENANDTWLAFYRNTGVRLKDAGVACVRLDHSGKDVTKGMRGGSAKYGDVDAVWQMSEIDDGRLYELECTDNRLVVHEKKLTIERVMGPPLYHKVSPSGKRDLYRRREEIALEWIPKLTDPPVTAPKHPGYKEVTKAMKAKGLNVSYTAVRNALKTYWESKGMEYEEEQQA